MSACTPYPATFPCDPLAMPPVLVNPYAPTVAPAVTPVLPVLAPLLDDELVCVHPVPEPSVGLLVAVSLAVGVRRWSFR